MAKEMYASPSKGNKNSDSASVRDEGCICYTKTQVWSLLMPSKP